MSSISIAGIQEPIAAEMIEFERKFKDFMKTDVFLLNKIMNFIVRRKGKQLRPMLVFLTAQMCGTTSEASFRGAALIELLHTATLVHDDVVDESLYRRNFFSVNAVWKNKIAVLVGDYLLSRGLLLSVENKDFALLSIVSDAVKQMSEGELLQMQKSRLLDIDEQTYLEVIYKKTAVLFGACCAVGASSVEANQETIAKLKYFGEQVGIAFQMKDDLFDYGKAKVGKPLGMDIREGKITMPLIYTLREVDAGQRRKILYAIKKPKKNEQTIKETIEMVRQAGGIEYTQSKMQAYVEQAKQKLSDIPDSSAKLSMLKLVDYFIKREI